MTAPPSPSARRLGAPRWLDARLVAGVLLVLVSVVGGARLVAAADRTTEVWAAVHPLPAGTVVEESDVRVADVRFADGTGEAYVGAASAPFGRVLSAPVGEGELLPVAAFRDGDPPLRRVAVPVSGLHTAADAEGLRSARVDVFATVVETGAAPVTRAVLRGATVVDVRAGSVSAGDLAVVVEVPPAAVPELVAALRGAEIDVVVVGGGDEQVPGEPVRFDPDGQSGQPAPDEPEAPVEPAPAPAAAEQEAAAP